jgi:dihydroorotate dehydrogenase
VSEPALASSPTLKPIVISAPFGNYIQPERATATLGTFTAAARGGRVWRILKTVRYYPKLGAWVNKIGLRNPGMPWLVKQVQAGRKDVSDKLVSIHGFTPADWSALLEQAASIRPLAIELNMSCPNVGHINWPESLFADAAATGVPVVVKIPPVRWQTMVDQARAAGLTHFHCCNTLPVPAGGMSGKPLMPLALGVIREMRRRSDAADLTILGGGGITTSQDIDAFVDAGADHVAIGTVTMNPLLLLSHQRLQPLIDRAQARFA